MARYANGTQPTALVEVEEFDEKHTCITVQEVRWLLQRCHRYSHYYMWFLLRITIGIRGRELLENVSLYTISPDLSIIEYKVDKPRTIKTPSGIVFRRIWKHRRYELDPFVREELRVYFDLHFRIVELENGKKIWVSPHKGQGLFPFKSINIVRAQWNKLRKKMADAGFNANRKVRICTTTSNNTIRITYVVRHHILRHFFASVRYVRENFDIKKVQDDLKHNLLKTTSVYVHTPKQLNSTPEELRKPWQELLGLGKNGQVSISQATTTEQTNMHMYGEDTILEEKL